MARPKCFTYKLTEEIPVSSLQTKFANHRRLGVFAQKGCVCVSCGRVGTRLIKGIDSKGGVHWDLYTDDLFPITVDHIVPRSLGGLDDMSNYQPMCSPCNGKKGNGLPGNSSQRKKYDLKDYTKLINVDMRSVVGKTIWKIVGKHYPRHLGVVNAISTNPHTGNYAAAIIKGDKISYYDFCKSLYLKLAQEAHS
ncbi:hypothetical protein b3_0199 [Synechococcus phage B3]|nr:hypothetical protein b3_0199 [Synechococcus phage B3]QGT54812.1 hypothetical protein b23_0197 [Synechococcus phage B23]